MARSSIHMAGACLGAVAFALPCGAGEAELQTYVVVGDAIPESLTGSAGDVTRGRALAVGTAARGLGAAEKIDPRLATVRKAWVQPV